MTPLARALAIAAAQVALLGVVGARLHYDRQVLPRAWLETAGVDPDLPIRGRYVALSLVVPTVEGAPSADGTQVAYGRLELRDGRPVAVLAGDAPRPDAAHPLPFVRNAGAADARWRLLAPVAYFLPEHARDPTLGRRPGELWVEATLPKDGAPRPIRLGLRRGERIEPLR